MNLLLNKNKFLMKVKKIKYQLNKINNIFKEIKFKMKIINKYQIKLIKYISLIKIFKIINKKNNLL